ncbi:MAG TPA: succinate dehydrogenase, hydrophobic membrane anchor protein [Gammaproteobacteria bacterium]|nr:succinate dehydrogenase, hydrophobic membrane anchor protein [Gammaproteobacteria bacterium]
MTAAAHGLRAWLLQRFTAAYLAAFVLYLIIRLGGGAPASFQAWHHWLAGPWVNLAAALFLVSLLGHAWVGVRDVIMDYVRPSGLRVSVMAAVGLFLIGMGAWGLRLLFLVAWRGA